MSPAEPAERAAGIPRPERIGRYRILRELGRGGMGVVYEAEQESPRRTVALKVVTAGILSREALVRFELEAEVLGRLQHPGIAQIYEAGRPDASSGWQPYFAMERIQGEPLTAHAARHDLSTRERLELVAKVCDAVHHAHQRGVIHRDLKPGNILVDETGQPKVLDFGVARATDSDLRTATLQTSVGQLVGTIPYMSPEQASGDPALLDVRSDVYSLGVVAYELVAGRLPYELDLRQVLEAVRVVREVEAQPLSSVNARLRGDVETVIGKALAKEPERRYPSAAAFAEDLRRYLAHEPIGARPPSAFYQLSKFARRNKALVGGVAGIFVALVVGLVGTTLGYLEAGRQRDDATAAKEEALAAAAQARQSSAFLRAILSGIDPAQAQGLDTTLLRRILAGTEARIGRELAGLPLVEAEIRSTIASTYAAIGDAAAGLPHARRAFELYLAEAGPFDALTLRARGEVGSLLRRLERFEEAEEHLQAASAAARERLAPADPARLFLERGLVVLYSDLDRIEEASRLLAEVQQHMEQAPDLPPEEHVHAAITQTTLLLLLGRRAEVGPVLQELVARAESELGGSHPLTLEVLNNLAGFLADEGRIDEALALRLDLLERCRRVYGPDHTVTRSNARSYAERLRSAGRWDEAEEALLETLASCERSLEPDHSETLGTRQTLALVWRAQGRYAEAEAALLDVAARLEQVLGPDHRETLEARASLGQLYWLAKRHAEAERVMAEVLDALERNPDAAPHDVLHARGVLAASLVGQGRYEDAEPLQRELLDARLEVDGADHPETLVARNAVALTLLYQRELDGALDLFLLSVAEHRRVLGNDHPETWTALYNTGATYRDLGRPDEGLPYLMEAARGWQDSGQPRHPTAVTMRRTLLGLLETLDRPAEEEPWRALELGLAREDLAPGDFALVAPLTARARTLVELGRATEALPLLEETLDLLSGEPDEDPRLAWTQTLYGAALAQRGRPDDARDLLLAAQPYLDPTQPRQLADSRAWLGALSPAAADR